MSCGGRNGLRKQVRGQRRAPGAQERKPSSGPEGGSEGKVWACSRESGPRECVFFIIQSPYAQCEKIEKSSMTNITAEHLLCAGTAVGGRDEASRHLPARWVLHERHIFPH